jgi:para-nitrobenzyl esterase
MQKAPVYADFGGVTMTGPVSGTQVLPVDPMVAFAEGRSARVPVLVGSNRDEFTLFVAGRYVRRVEDFSAERYPQLLSETFGANAIAVAERYPPDRFNGSVPLAYAAALTDRAFACPADRISDDLAMAEPVYAYEFNDPSAPAPEPLRDLPFQLGASHSLELRYLFDIGHAAPLNPAQRALSDQMIDYWAHFVTTGSPGSEWPALHSGDAGERMLLQPDGSRIVTTFEEAHQCAFWAGMN